MKQLLLIILSFLLISCGGGGGGSSSDSGSSFSGVPTENFSEVAYSMWDYIINDSSTNSSLSGASSTFTKIDDTTYEEELNGISNEKIRYKKNSSSIHVTFYKNSNETLSYDIKNYVHIGEQTTVSKSACMLVDHYFYYNGYYDVIEIDCGKHKGFYAKGKGQIDQQ